MLPCKTRAHVDLQQFSDELNITSINGIPNPRLEHALRNCAGRSAARGKGQGAKGRARARARARVSGSAAVRARARARVAGEPKRAPARYVRVP